MPLTKSTVATIDQRAQDDLHSAATQLNALTGTTEAIGNSFSDQRRHRGRVRATLPMLSWTSFRPPFDGWATTLYTALTHLQATDRVASAHETLEQPTNAAVRDS
jgi:hypothetical protein